MLKLSLKDWTVIQSNHQQSWMIKNGDEIWVQMSGRSDARLNFDLSPSWLNVDLAQVQQNQLQV